MGTIAHQPTPDLAETEDPVLERHEALQLITDALPALIARVDAQERYCFNNRAYEAWFGLPQERLTGSTIRELLGEEVYARLREHIQAALGGKKQTFESVIPHRTHGERVMHIDYIPQFNAANLVDGLYILMSDVTEHRRAEEEIRRLNGDLERRVFERTLQLEATNRELEAFCYSVSHDLRAPLRAIRGFTDVLLEQYAPKLDGRGQEFLQRTCEASQQMDKLIDDLLKLSRVVRGELQTEKVSLSALAQEIVAELRRAEPERQVTITISPDLTVFGDRRLLRIVLDNLLRNAWKFTGKRESAEIELGRSDGENSAFYVRDNGAGFDMAYAGKLFGVFQRLHSAADFPGSGVGLAIVQRIINRHGGRTWALGKAGSGATFYFALPAK